MGYFSEQFIKSHLQTSESRHDFLNFMLEIWPHDHKLRKY